MSTTASATATTDSTTTDTTAVTTADTITDTTSPAWGCRPISSLAGDRRTPAGRRPGIRTWDASTPVADLVRAVGEGDERAWAELVRRYQGLVRHVAARHGLGEAERADVCQATWVRLLNHAGRLQEPERIAAWLVTTSRRESLRILTGASRRREAPGGLIPDEHLAVRTATGMVEAPLLRAEQHQEVRRAVEQLPGRSGTVLRLLMDDDLSYAEVARRVGIAPGSVGPLRNRALRRLRDDRRLVPLALAS